MALHHAQQSSDLGRILFLVGVVGILALLVLSGFGRPVEPSLVGAFSTFCLVGGGFSLEGKRRNGNGNGKGNGG